MYNSWFFVFKRAIFILRFSRMIYGFETCLHWEGNYTMEWYGLHEEAVRTNGDFVQIGCFGFTTTRVKSWLWPHPTGYMFYGQRMVPIGLNTWRSVGLMRFFAKYLGMKGWQDIRFTSDISVNSIFPPTSGFLPNSASGFSRRWNSIITVDVDSTVITRYGSQQGALRGYNRNSHHPLMAFVDECKMVANFWLRSGNAYTTNNFLSFLEDTMDGTLGRGSSLGWITRLLSITSSNGLIRSARSPMEK